MIIINGKSYKGNNVTIVNNKVIIDGKPIGPDEDSKEINIQVTGNIESLDVDYCSNLKVQGDVKDISTTSGDVSITGNVTGSIQATSGDIDVRGNVGGSVQTSSGDVECYEVAGNVKTRSGDIDKKFR